MTDQTVGVVCRVDDIAGRASTHILADYDGEGITAGWSEKRTRSSRYYSKGI